ncbi:MAG: NTP transferase domain-containing protein [Candidatus Aenigmarchaeota archaeon]|nr:NTP transferase domain-containing protein [Candidatus Aenigmarchaeota archaeon]
MQTVILAGGAGNRVYPLSLTKPKPMFKILGKPLLHHVIDTLKEAKLKNFIVVTGHHDDQIKNYLGDGSQIGVNIQYTRQGKPLGMANAIQTVKDLIEDNFLVVNGDDVFDASLIEQQLSMLKNGGVDSILSCKPVTETWKYGILKMSGDKVTQIIEKPPLGQEPSNLAVIGSYILPPKIFDYYEKIPVSDSQHEMAIQKLIDNGGTVNAVKYDGVFSGYKHPWDLFAINQYLMEKLLTKQTIEDGANVSEKAEVNGNVWISKGAKILENAFIRGPCYIGVDSVIGNNALIRNFSSIGDKSVIGFSSEITNSIIGDNCWFHTNYVGDSIIGDNCSFGSGAVTANFRFDEETVKVNIGGKRIDSGRNKLGVIMADNCKVGVNATLSPGVKLGPNSIVGPNVYLKSDLEPNKIILINKESYTIRENKVDMSSSKKDELHSKLKKI